MCTPTPCWLTLNPTSLSSVLNNPSLLNPTYLLCFPHHFPNFQKTLLYFPCTHIQYISCEAMNICTLRELWLLGAQHRYFFLFREAQNGTRLHPRLLHIFHN